MMNRIATTLALLATAAAVNVPSKGAFRRGLQDDYYCLCNCDPEGSISESTDFLTSNGSRVWVETSLSSGLEDVDLESAEMGQDGDGTQYYHLCVDNRKVFDLLYDHGDKVYCDDACLESSSTD